MSSRLERNLVAARLRVAFARPRQLEPAATAAALRLLGRRAEVHPVDVIALLHTSRESAMAYAQANAEHYGLPDTWHVDVEGGVVAVTDLRHRLIAEGIPVTDPALPDTWSRFT